MLDPHLYDAIKALHDEAHADDKVAFAHCTRQTCKDAHEAMDAHRCEEPVMWLVDG